MGDLNSPLKYSVNRSENRWDGGAFIPLDYLPPKVVYNLNFSCKTKLSLQ